MNYLSSILNHRFFAWGIFLFSIFYFLFLGSNEFVWYDEGVTLFHSNKTFFELLEFSKKDNNPPLFNTLLFGWSKIFGYSILASRALSSVIMSIAVALIFSLGKKIYGSAYAAISILLLITFEATIFYSVEIRAYGLMLLLATSNLYLLYNIYTNNKTIYLGLWVLTIVLLFYTHYAAAIYMIASFLTIIPYFIRINHFKKYGLWTGFFGALGLVLIYLWIKHPLDNATTVSDGTFWLQSPNWFEYKTTLTEFSELFGMNYLLYFSLIIIGIAILIFYQHDIRKNKILSTSLFFLFILPILSYLISQWVPMFGFRYLIYLLPIFVFSLFLTISYLPMKYGLGVSGILLILSVSSASGTSYRPDYDSLQKVVSKNIAQDHFIIINESRTALPYLINKYGNVFRSNAELEAQCAKDNIIRTSTKNFIKDPDFSYLNAKDELVYINGGNVDPKRQISSILSTGFDLIAIDSTIHPFIIEKFKRKKRVEKESLIFADLSGENLGELTCKMMPFDKMKENIPKEYNDKNEYVLGIEIDLANELILNRTSGLVVEIPMKFENINPECLFIAEVKDENGKTVSWEKRRLTDYFTAGSEWQTKTVTIPIKNGDGTFIKSYIWNKGKCNFSVKPYKCALRNVQKSNAVTNL